MNIDLLKAAIREVPDFPKEGILFYDIMPLLQDPKLLKVCVDLYVERYEGQSIDKVAAIDARGFFFGAPLAYHLGAGLVPIRKKGKLPFATIEASYDLEYGSNTLAMHTDAVKEGERVLLIDDLLATGGTAAASADLISQLGGEIVEVAFLIELAFLKGREKLKDFEIFAPIVY
jgi:adenine phosphoribosyltransferase